MLPFISPGIIISISQSLSLLKETLERKAQISSHKTSHQEYSQKATPLSVLVQPDDFCDYRLFKAGALLPERVRLTRSKRSRFWISPALSGHLEKNRRLKVCGACGDVKQDGERERKRASWREAHFKTVLYYRVLPVLNREHLINHWCFSSQSKMEKSHGHSWLINLWPFFVSPILSWAS